MRANRNGVARVRQSAIEALERRMMLSSAIAAFGANQTFGAGVNPTSIATADLNRDGKPDLIVSNSLGTTVNVLLGNGNGTFQAAYALAVGSQPYSIAAADVNGDGKPDLIVANFASSTISVLLGNGDGSFLPQQAFPAGGGAYAVAIADVNGDGKLDAVVADYTANTISVLLGAGNGTFASPQTIATGLLPNSIAIADLNGDGRPDVVAANFGDGSASIFLGNGNGAFHAQQTIDAGTAPMSVVVGDINSDGKLDMAVANFATAGSVSVMLGNGDGSFQARKTIGTGQQTTAVAIADINRDGKMDLAVANFGINDAGVLLGNGDGSFQPQKIFPTEAYPDSIAVVDVNGDGRPDLVTADLGYHKYDNSTISVLLGDVPPSVVSMLPLDPVGPITSASNVSYSVHFNEPVTGVDPTDFTVSDSTGAVSQAPVPVSVNGGGSDYTVSFPTGTTGFTIRLNLVDDGSIRDTAGNPLQSNGVASFAPPRTSLLSGIDVLADAIGDVNADGKPDLVVGVQADSNPVLGVLTGNGDGTFAPLNSFTYSGSPGAIAIADVNLDGKPDLLVSDTGRNGGVEVLLGNGDGSFAGAQVTSATPYPSSVKVADFNGDGSPDIVLVSRNSSVFVLLGNGNGTFGPQKAFATNAAPSAVNFGDFNGDGKLDIVFASSINGRAGVLLGNGDGTFQAARTVVGRNPLDIDVADFNGDGKLDFAVPDYGFAGQNNDAGIFLGNGDGTFQSERTFFTWPSDTSIIATDMNGDGKTDLVVADSTNSTPPGDSVSVLLGNGDGTFRTQRTFPVAVAGHLAISDLNRDGKPDIVVAGGQPVSPVALSLFLATSHGSYSGDAYNYVFPTEIANGSSGNDQITLIQYENGSDIQWYIQNHGQGQIPITDPLGLTINGNGGIDTIYLNYFYGSPLPQWLHLNGQFKIVAFESPLSLAGSTVDIGGSTVYVDYTGAPSPLTAIQTALAAGYAGGSWAGLPGTFGAITSAAAASDPSHFAVGYADSADNIVPGQPANTIEIRYTVTGDANLDGIVNATDAITMARHYLLTGSPGWDVGNFNYDALINLTDAILLQANFNKTATQTATSSSTSGTAGIATVAATVVNPPALIQSPPDSSSSTSETSDHHVNDDAATDPRTNKTKRHDARRGRDIHSGGGKRG